MKKSLVLAIIFAVSCFIGHSQVQFGFTAGAVLSNQTFKFESETLKGKSVPGITAGILVDVPAGEHFSFQPAVNFVQKGTKEEEAFGTTTETTKLTVNAIEVPLNFLYNTRGDGGNFFIGAGPSVAFAISGKYKFDDGTNSSTMKAQFGNSDDDNLRGLDVGANFTTGYTFSNGLLLSANYNMGLSNLMPGGSSDGKLKSSYFGIKLGFLLKGSK